MIAACAVHIPLRRLPAHVVVIRDGRRLVTSAPAHARPACTSARATNCASGRDDPPVVLRRQPLWSRGRQLHPDVPPARDRTVDHVEPRTGVLALEVTSGRVDVRAGDHSRRAVVVSRELHGVRAAAGHQLRRRPQRPRRSGQPDGRWIGGSSSPVAQIPALRIDTRAGYTAISDRARAAPRHLAVRHFARAAPATPRRPPDAVLGRRPAVLGRLPRPRSDPRLAAEAVSPAARHPRGIQRAAAGQLPRRHRHRGPRRPARVRDPVGSRPHPLRRQPATSTSTSGASSTGMSSQRSPRDSTSPPTARSWAPCLPAATTSPSRRARTQDYLNPLRPGGSLAPYHDHEPPIIGMPRIFADGSATVAAFDPQSFVGPVAPNETPVLAPSSLAWRLFTAAGRPLTGLLWAMRGSQNYPPVLSRRSSRPAPRTPASVLHASPSVHPQLGLPAGRRPDRAPAARRVAGRALPADGLCLGLGGEHLGARRLDHRCRSPGPPRRSNSAHSRPGPARADGRSRRRSSRRSTGRAPARTRARPGRRARTASSKSAA